MLSRRPGHPLPVGARGDAALKEALRGGIIAAGEGSRLRAGGFAVPKPMVPIGGIPLIERAIRNFVAARITSLTIIVNERDRECAEWARARFPDLELRAIVKTTASSLASFAEVISSPGSGRALISTVDAWCDEADFVRFVGAALDRPPDATVLAVTPFVADEKPVWVRLDDAGRVVTVGGPAGDAVTAGIYLVSERVRKTAPPSALPRLRDFLAWLAVKGEPLYGEVIERVVDVDRAEDVALAEALTRESSALARFL